MGHSGADGYLDPDPRPDGTAAFQDVTLRAVSEAVREVMRAEGAPPR